MSKPNKKQVWLKNLYADLREVFSLYDLEIMEEDGQWFRNVVLEDAFCIYLKPFSAHTPFPDETRGAKKGTNGWLSPGSSPKNLSIE